MLEKIFGTIGWIIFIPVILLGQLIVAWIEYFSVLSEIWED